MCILGSFTFTSQVNQPVFSFRKRFTMENINRQAMPVVPKFCAVEGCGRLLADDTICSKHRVRKEDGVLLYLHQAVKTLAPTPFIIGEVQSVDLDRGMIDVVFSHQIMRLESRFFRKITASSKIENVVAPTDWILEANISI
jgi:hypothetical protein